MTWLLSVLPLGLLSLGTGDLERAQKTFRALLLQKLDATSPISKGEVFYHLGEIAHRRDGSGLCAELDRQVLDRECVRQDLLPIGPDRHGDADRDAEPHAHTDVYATHERDLHG